MRQENAGADARRRVLGLCAIAGLGAALVTGLAAAPAPKPVAGVVIDVKGKPSVKRSSDGKTAVLGMRDMVYEGDVIKTGAGERAALAFVGGAEMRINESSEFAMESGGGMKPTSVYTKAGEAWTRLLHGKAGMNVRSPLAVASVRGTEADVEVEKRMTVKVYEGLVDVANGQGRQSLRAGMMSDVGAGQAPGAPRTMAPGDYGSWQNTLKPQDVDGSLQQLNKEAEKTRTGTIRFKDKNGQEKSVEFKLKKK